MAIKGKLKEAGPAREIRREINDIKRQLKALQLRPGLGVRVTSTAKGQIVSVPKTTVSTTAAAPVEAYLIGFVSGAYLVCRKFTVPGGYDDQPGTAVEVGKPYYLQPANWDKDSRAGLEYESVGGETGGQVRRFRADTTVGSRQVNQSLFPVYRVDDIIWVTEWEDPQNSLLGTGGEAITLYDMNVDARHFVTNLVEITHRFTPTDATPVTRWVIGGDTF